MAKNTGEAMVDAMVGDWVKVPGLRPDETNAVNYLDLEQLYKLQERVTSAIQRASRKAQALDTLQPGTKVSLKRGCLGKPAGTVGVVINRRVIEDNTLQPDDYVPVAFEGYGLCWVPVLHLFTEATYRVGYEQ